MNGMGMRSVSLLSGRSGLSSRMNCERREVVLGVIEDSRDYELGKSWDTMYSDWAFII